MPVLQPVPFNAWVVAVVFVGGVPMYALGDGSVRIVRDRMATTVKAHDGAILAAIAAPDNSALLTGGEDGKLVRTNIDATTAVIAERPKKWVDSLATGPGGMVAFGAGKQAVVIQPDGTEKVFDHDNTVTGVTFAPKGSRLAVTHRDGVTLWWINTASPPTKLEWRGGQSNPTFSPDGRFLMTVMQENSLHGWQLPQATHVRMTGYPTKPKSLSWSPRGRLLASSGAEAAIIWPFHFKDGPLDKPATQRGGRGSMVTVVACHPTKDDIAIGYRDGCVTVGPMGDGPNGVILRPPADGPISALAWDSAGERVAFGTETGAAGWVDLRE